MDKSSHLNGHNERNKSLLNTFREKQIDIDHQRSIDLHFWAGSQLDSVQLANELTKLGFVAHSVRPAQSPDDRELWTIEAETSDTVLHVTAEDFTATLIDLAARFGAVYDGWGTSI